MNDYLILTFLATGVAYGLYYLFLKREKCFKINRAYLIGSLALCFLAPLVHLNFPEQVQVAETAVNFKEATAAVFAPEMTQQRGHITEIAAPERPWWPLILFYVYITVTCVFLFRFGSNLFKIIRHTKRVSPEKFGKFKLIPLADSGSPFSFFRYIFIHRDDLKNKALSGTVIQHEMAHGRQYHTLDILFVEILTCLFWFNPFVWCYKKALVENHEFLADAEVLREGAALNAYAQQLIDAGNRARTYSLLSGFNFSQTKTRIIMLYKKSSSRTKIVFKTGLALGLFSLMFLLTSFIAGAQESPFVVVVNAGHGGKDPGAQANNAVEKTINLQVAKKLAALSSKEVKIVLVRDKDKFITLSDRILFINKQQHADMMLSLHCSVAKDPSYNGMKFYTATKSESLTTVREFAAALSANFVFNDLGSNFTMRIANKPKIYSADFKILSSVDPDPKAILLIMGYLSNKEDAKKLTRPEYQKALAKTIYASLVEISRKNQKH